MAPSPVTPCMPLKDQCYARWHTICVIPYTRPGRSVCKRSPWVLPLHNEIDLPRSHHKFCISQLLCASRDGFQGVPLVRSQRALEPCFVAGLFGRPSYRPSAVLPPRSTRRSVLEDFLRDRPIAPHQENASLPSLSIQYMRFPKLLILAKRPLSPLRCPTVPCRVHAQTCCSLPLPSPWKVAKERRLTIAHCCPRAANTHPAHAVRESSVW